MNILTHSEMIKLLGLESRENKKDMIEKQLICFDIGYQVENLTDFRDRLVDLFGIGVLSSMTGVGLLQSLMFFWSMAL